MRIGFPITSTTADVAVVGSGVAGLAAAIEAATSGARVKVFEAESSIGGASNISGGGCCIVGTPLQRQNSIIDSVDLAMSDWVAMGGSTVDKAWARQYLENSTSEVYEWAEKLGVRWISLQQPEGNSVARWHQPEGWGREVVLTLLKYARALGVEVYTRSKIQRLLQDNGRITGLQVSSDENRYVVSCENVVVCTGGFSGELSKLMKSAPHLSSLPRVLSGGSATARGSGHDLLEETQADFTCLDHIWLYPVGTPDPTDAQGTRGLGVRGLKGDIWLNANGRRFHNEQLKGGFSGTKALLAQPEQTAWMVFHGSEIPLLELINNPDYFPPALDGKTTFRMNSFWNDSSYAWRCKSITELATRVGLPVGNVISTVNKFNADIKTGIQKDSVYGRSLADAVPLESDLAAIQLIPMAQKTFGGVKTDLSCRVLRDTDQPIQGLYAAGEVAGMAGGCINGKAAIEGTMFGPCLYSGRVAGGAAGRSKAHN